MLGLRTEEHKAVAVVEDEQVRTLDARLRDIKQKLAAAEAEENEYISIMEGFAPGPVSEEARLAAYEALRTRRGTQSAWYLPTADSLRAERKKLSTDLTLARASAQARLDEVRRSERSRLIRELFDSWQAAEDAAARLRDFDKEGERLGASSQIAFGEVHLPESDLRQHQRRIAADQGWLD